MERSSADTPSTSTNSRVADPQTAILEKVVMESIREQRLRRRWGIFFKLLFAAYLVGFLVLLQWDFDREPTGPHTALLDIQGVIGPSLDMDADRFAQGLRAAFEGEEVAGIILRINSPGGSPVHAAYISDEIRRLRALHPDRPVHAVITDVCASGGYYVAAAADRIYANPSSIVGSIGVLINAFGFVDSLEKLGIERRLMTAGEHKGMFDPFLPLDEADTAHVQVMLDAIHGHFIEAVRAGRGERLSDDPVVFSGRIWSGEEALRLGLIDEFGSAGQVARDVFGAERIIDYTPRESIVNRVARQIGLSFARSLGTGLRDASWQWW